MNNKTNSSNTSGLKFGLNVKPTSKPILGMGRSNTLTSSSTSSGSGIGFRFGHKKKVASELIQSAEDDDHDSVKVKDLPNSSSSATTLSSHHDRQPSSVHTANAELSKIQSHRSLLAEKQHEKALEEDSSIFDYDGFHDVKKQAELERKRQKEGLEAGGALKKPRYMEQLLQAAAKRKIEQERIEERKVQKEREKEGDLYGDKEMFVTEAYLKKQEELKLLEEEERKREEMESKNQDMTGFYRNLLEEREKQMIVVSSSDLSKKKDLDQEEENSLDAIQQQQVLKAIQEGRVQVNDSNELVDKRQLLSGGLNITAKGIARKEKEEALKKQKDLELAQKAERERREKEEREKQLKEQEKLRQKKLLQNRRAEILLEQQREVAEQRKKEQEEKQQQLINLTSSQVKPETVSDARARYLARKIQKQQEDGDD